MALCQWLLIAVLFVTVSNSRGLHRNDAFLNENEQVYKVRVKRVALPNLPHLQNVKTSAVGAVKGEFASFFNFIKTALIVIGVVFGVLIALFIGAKFMTCLKKSSREFAFCLRFVHHIVLCCTHTWETLCPCCPFILHKLCDFCGECCTTYFHWLGHALSCGCCKKKPVDGKPRVAVRIPRDHIRKYGTISYEDLKQHYYQQQQQGYPKQQQGYPQQQHGYPNQQQGYP
eukprot:TRINITY_DN2272_c0_g1_i15.p1 TRINITY_DN2272_c0_g1~~TRINITY_DN2272_c0_g1_i15.p1  ORF type:complete len:229 (-),score=28.38 TRINITY_DN2272_c0_g1_i15:248-934(-)